MKIKKAQATIKILLENEDEYYIAFEPETFNMDIENEIEKIYAVGQMGFMYPTLIDQTITITMTTRKTTITYYDKAYKLFKDFFGKVFNV